MGSRAVRYPFSNDRREVPEPAIILYDGVCHLCQGFVGFIIKRDPKKRFRFGFIQSAASQEKLRAFPTVPGGLNSVILLEGGRVFTKSSAALRIARRLEGGWPIFYVFILVPPFLRDAVYDFIARHRYRWFGRSPQCQVPAPEIGDRFLD